jgi:tetratricopeptide (TPR) repeat protein
LHEEILATLAQRAPGLEVISRTTMMMYRLKPEPIAAVARELGATHVIEGSVRRDGQQVRLTLQLIDARTDDHIWAHDYDRTLTHALTLQSEVANEVASQLSVQLAGGAESAKPPTHDPEAYDLYLKVQLGRGAAVASGGIEPVRRIEELLTAAIARDPSFVAAYAQRVAARITEFFIDAGASEKALAGAREDLETAQRLAPGNPDVLAARALYLSDVDNDPDGALVVYSAAEAAGLADPMWINNKAGAFITLGRCDEAIQVYERILPVDPRNPFIVTRFAEDLAACHRPIEALRRLDSAIQQLPDTEAFRSQRAYVVFAFTGNIDELNALAVSMGPSSFRSEIEWEFDRLRWTHRYPELQQLLARVATPVLPAPVFGAGEQPTARYRGWMHLQLGDRAKAAQDGAAVLDFVAHQKQTLWNRNFLRQLTAEGYTFTGDREHAIISARAALGLVRPTQLSAGSVGLQLAAVYAWSGAEDDAVNLLEQLATSIPGPGPAEITRDPLYTIPLAHNVRFQQLVARLEAQMRATKLQ